MEDWFASGDFSRAPIARVLAEIWKQGLSGSLYVKAAGDTKCLSFERGSLVLDSVSFEEQDFLRFLLTTGETDLIGLNRVEEHVQRTGVSTLRSLVDGGLIEPARLWTLLRAYARQEALSLLEEAGPEREFHSRSGPPARIYVEAIDIPELLLEGARRIRDEATIGRVLPGAGERIRRLPVFSADAFGLSLTEKYVLGLLEPPATVEDLTAASDVGASETRRALFVLVLLGLAGTAGPKPKTGKLAGDLSLAGMDRILAAFNAKCVFVFKHVSKEIGPVAFNLISKALDEVRDRLDPAFRSAELKPDGRLEIKSLIRVNANVVGDESRRSLLKSMDEILAAELLLVKRTLGPENESALVRSLERLGEAP